MIFSLYCVGMTVANLSQHINVGGTVMALDSVTNAAIDSTSLFRPVPMNKLQQNLSQFYQKTSSFVNDQFKQLIESDEDISMKPRKKLFSPSELDDEERPRLNPQGLGRYVDIRV